MNPDQLKKQEGVKITEGDLDAVYLYLDMNYHSMTEDEISFWLDVLKNIDPNFYED